MTLRIASSPHPRRVLRHGRAHVVPSTAGGSGRGSAGSASCAQRLPPTSALGACLLVDRNGAAEPAEANATPSPHRSTISPIEHAVTDRPNAVVVGRIGGAGQRMCIVVSVEHPPPDAVVGGSVGECVEPTVVDHEPTFVAHHPLVRPEPEITELHDTATPLPDGEFAQRPHPVQVAVGVASDEHPGRRSAGWVRNLRAAAPRPRGLQRRTLCRALAIHGEHI